MEVLLKGVGVGFAVAAPVGPIGLLCIRRTLNNGMAAGLASGLGAAAADALYGVLVAAGLSATGILVAYATSLKIGGGLLIAMIGILSLRAVLSSAERRNDVQRYAAKGAIFPAFTTTFLLTLSNPMTVLAFVGLVAGLATPTTDDPNAPYWLVAGVFLGSSLWWLFLISLTQAAKSRITPKVTRWFDLTSGAVLLVWGLWIAVAAL